MSVDVGALYEAHWTPIYRFLRRRLPMTAHAEIEDLTSAVFERVIRAAPRYQRGSDATEQAWLYQIARNLLIDTVRRSKLVTVCELSHKTLKSRAILDAGSTKHDIVLDIRAALQRVSSKDRYFLTAYHLDSLMDHEIGEKVGMNRVAVRKQRERSMERLRRVVEGSAA